ncbi:hypothetical protein ACFL08_00285 [Patescibacteria group bacterium]
MANGIVKELVEIKRELVEDAALDAITGFSDSHHWYWMRIPQAPGRRMKISKRKKKGGRRIFTELFLKDGGFWEVECFKSLIAKRSISRQFSYRVTKVIREEVIEIKSNRLREQLKGDGWRFFGRDSRGVEVEVVPRCMFFKDMALVQLNPLLNQSEKTRMVWYVR